MDGVKRKHDEMLATEAADAAPPSDPPSNSPETPLEPETPGDDDEHVDKKSKTSPQPAKRGSEGHIQGSPTHATAAVSPRTHNLKQKQAETHEKVLNRSQMVKNALAEKKKAARSTVEPDAEMSDAPPSNMEGEVGSSLNVRADRKKAAPAKSAGKAKGAQTDIDQEMSDAPSDNGDNGHVVSGAQSVSGRRGAILPFAPLPTVLAHDMANNRYGPTDPTVQLEYLKEVDQRQLHPSRHPMQTPSSAVSQHARHAIYERYFLGKTNEECIGTWNSYGFNVTSAQAISKAVLRDTATWFTEENAVLPWIARKNDEKKKLKALGMTPRHFPAPSTTTPPPAAPAHAAPAPAAAPAAVVGSRDVKTSKKQSNPSVSKQNASEPSKQDTSGLSNQDVSQVENTIDVNASTVNSDGHDDAEEGDDGEQPSGSSLHDSDPESDPGSDPESDTDTNHEPASVLGSQYESDSSMSDLDSICSDDDDIPTVAPEGDFRVKFADSDGIEPKMRALIMAATTAFDLGTDAVVALLVDGGRYKVRVDDLVKHCGFVRGVVAQGQPCRDFDLKEYDPTIVRAFIQAVTTPGRLDPKNQLPDYIFHFEFADNQELHGWDHSDPIGVIDGDRRKFCKIDWDVGACIMMYQLADAFDCSLVRNLVVDQLRVLYEEDRKSIETGKKRILKRSRIPLELLDELELEKHFPFICILGALYAYRTWPRRDADAQFPWPSELSDEVIGAINEWLDDKKDTFSTTDQERYCFRYHHHAAGEVCHMSTDDKDLPPTRELISGLFSSLRNEAAKQCAEALADFDRYDPNERLSYNTILVRGEMMQWTFRREEKVAYELLQHECAREGSSKKNPDKEDRRYCQRMLKKLEWTPHLKNLRTEHWNRWNVFEREWMLGTKLEEATKMAVNGDFEMSEPLPWNGD